MKSQKLEQLRRCNKLLKKKSFKTYTTFLSVLLRSIEHPTATELLGFLLTEDYNSLVKLADSISSTKYGTAGEHRLLNQLSAVIRKYPFPSGVLEYTPRETAIRTFRSAEHHCSRVNRRFSLYGRLRNPHERELSHSRSWIYHTLGDLRLSEVWDLCDFGPGASVGVHGNATNSARKLLAKEWSVSPSAFYYAYAAISNDIHITELLLREGDSRYFCHDLFKLSEKVKGKARLVDYNKITFVPKTAKTERTIAVEPLLNGYVQKGVDSFMRKRLKRVGINLDDQTRNQKLAREGSLGEESDPYVTIDLSSASDSVSLELCRYMLPPEWFEFLNSLRSKRFELDGTLTSYNKFVSMGNGFCFPLETLIFASLCEAAYRGSSQKADYSVYGDDIIVRSSVADRLLSLLRVCGFKVNREKTFLSGPFRESCGADWFEGEDVRPLSLDYEFDSLENIFKFCNLARSKGAWECIFDESLVFLQTLIPRGLYFTRPYKGQVDTALEVPLDVFLSSPFSRYSRKTFSWSWLEIMKSSFPDFPVRSFAGYDVALMRGILTGSKSPTPFAERRKTCTKIRRICPSSGWSIELPGSHWVTRLSKQ